MIHLVVEKTIDVVVLLYITPLTNYKKKYYYSLIQILQC